MALAIVNTQVPISGLKKKSLGNKSQIGKPYRISPLPFQNFPTRSEPRNSLQVKAETVSDNLALSVAEIGQYELSSDDKPHNSFPTGFFFGSSSSAFQVEGGTKAGGRGPSIMDNYCEKYPGKIADKSCGDPAAGSFYHYKDDVKALADIGLNAYRFSIAWPRILPNGDDDHPNEEGILYYNNVIDELHKYGIEPFVTLFHWDLPLALQDKYGGFLSRKIVDDYKKFVKICFERFGDRVKHWITVNEPLMYSTLGYTTGALGAGHCTPDLFYDGTEYTCPAGDSIREPYQVAHHLLLAHAEAVDLYRKNFKAKQGGEIGITLNSNWFVPIRSGHPLDKEAQKRALDFSLGWFLDPISFGNYPFSMRAVVRDRLPIFTPEESKKITNSYDFIGINYYTSQFVRDKLFNNYTDKPVVSYDDAWTTNTVEKFGVPIGPHEDKSWVYSYPKGIYNLLMHVKERYNNPEIYITENGTFDCTDSTNSPTDDMFRVEYHNSHIQELEHAISDKADVRGYFIWSLLDSFEFGSGYTCRYGLHHINYENLSKPDPKRIPKQSAIWLAKFLSNNVRKPKTIPDQLLKEEVSPVTVTVSSP